MLLIPVLALVLLGVAVLATAAGERPRVLTLLAVGATGLVVLLVAVAVLGVGLRGSDGHHHDSGASAPPAPADRPAVEVREVDAVIRPRGASDVLDRLPARTTRLLRVRTVDPVVLRQCVDAGPCRPGVPMHPVEGSALGLVELDRTIAGVDCGTARCTLVVTDGRSNRSIETVRLWFGRAAPTVPAEVPALPPLEPDVEPSLPGGQLASGLAAAVILLFLAGWLLRRRPDEQVEDPFWGVGLDVPEWEGVDIEASDDELLGAPGR